MTDKTKLSEQVAKGQNAQIAISELEKAFAVLEKDCFEVFRKSDIHDDGGRKMCRLYLKVMDDVKQRFQVAVANGEAASKALLKMEKESKLKKVLKRV